MQTYITRGKLNPVRNDTEKRRSKDVTRKISTVLKKSESLRTQDEIILLQKYPDITTQIIKRKERILIYKERAVEKEDAIVLIEKKVDVLATIISQAKHLVCYTGAGISTSAHIPDYRGSNGIWTLLQKGQNIKEHDISSANPTYTHMALYELHRRKLLRHVVSQNCDGLHLRSGLPRSSVSEIHGNMYIEVCKICKPNTVFWRLFDTTEMTGRYCHKTNRICHNCAGSLYDSIVHFGERGNMKWPLNWQGACYNAEKADVILCLGSSLKVLKKYTWLWQMDRPAKSRAKICIVNLQWTPKDNISTIKINGKCDLVMKMLMKILNIAVPRYSKALDPIFFHSSLLMPEELHTLTQPILNCSEIKLQDVRQTDQLVLENTCSNANNVLIGKGPLIRTPLKNGSSIKTNIRANDNLTKLNFITSTTVPLLLNHVNILPPKSKFSECYADLKNKVMCNINSSIEPISLVHKKPLHNLNIGVLNETKIGNSTISPGTLHFKEIEVSNEIKNVKSEQGIHEDSVTFQLENFSNDLDQKVLRKLPCWYDVKYAYSGLHSIVLPPPSDLNIWSCQIIPFFKMNKKAAECEFCFDHYAELKCQFYNKWFFQNRLRKEHKNGRLIICECCDYSDDNANELNSNPCFSNKRQIHLEGQSSRKLKTKIQAGWYGKGCKNKQKRKK